MLKYLTVFLSLGFVLSACTGTGNYYMAKCSNQGYTAGTNAHKTCMQKEKAWIEWTDTRARRDGFGR